MIGEVTITGFGNNTPVAHLQWRCKKKRRNFYDIGSVKIYKHQDAFDLLPEPTKVKLELLFSELYRLVKLRKIKSEYHMEITVNGFMLKNKPAILFNGRKHFEIQHIANDDLLGVYNKKELVDKKYFIKKNKENIKRLLNAEKE